MIPSSTLESDAKTEIKPTALAAEYHPEERSIFSAYEVGRATVRREQLQKETGYDYSLPFEQDSPSETYDLFHRYTDLDFLPVRNQSGWISGYLTRKMFLASLSESQFSRELLFRKEASIGGLINRQIVCLNAYTTLPEASEILMQRPGRMRFDPFVVTLDQHFYGISTVDRVLRGINNFLARDLDAVKESQMSMITSDTGQSGNDVRLDHHYHLTPLNGPGGDFVKVYEFNSQHSIAVLFDVCGKGVRAASMVSVIASLFYSMWKRLQWSGSLNHRVLKDELTRVNNDLFKLTNEEMYATGIVALIDRQNHILSVFDYGHGMLWLRRNQRIHHIGQSAEHSVMPFFGITENLSISPYSCHIKPGDVLIMCSDGIPEQTNHDREAYGFDRLQNIFVEVSTDSLKEVSDHIIQDWEKFRGSARVKDDVSLLLFRIS